VPRRKTPRVVSQEHHHEIARILFYFWYDAVLKCGFLAKVGQIFRQRLQEAGYHVKKRILMLKALASTVAFVLLLPPVYADPSPYPPSKPFDWVEYSIEVVVSEAFAWIIGAELLWRLSRKSKQEVARVESYMTMLVAMIVSFSIGLLFWKTFGWI
jgi:hypothetical protein